MQKGVKLVSLVYSSNLDGYTLPVEEPVKLARKYDALVMLDGAQAAPHHAINVKNWEWIFGVFRTQDARAVWHRRIVRPFSAFENLAPLLWGGHSVKDSRYDGYEIEDVPGRFEAGLQNYGGIIGLGEAVKFIKQVGFDFIIKQEFELNYFITRELKQMSGVSLAGVDDPKTRGGIVNFYHEKMDSHQLSIFWMNRPIFSRAGSALRVHSWYNSRQVKDSIRASFYFYNTIDEAEKMISALKKFWVWCKIYLL